MKLRNQLLTLSLATLLVPWFGWKLVQELEQFLRAGQESALLASARTVAQALPREHQTLLLFGRATALPLREFDSQPIVDGYPDEWEEPASALAFDSPDGVLRLELLGGGFRNQLFLFARVGDITPMRALPPDAVAGPDRAASDGLSLYLRNERGMNHFRLHTAAPGPLLVSSQVEGGGQLEGHWQEQPDGYHVEIALPPGARSLDISIGAVDVSVGAAGQVIRREAGTLRDGLPGRWLNPAPPVAALRDWLAEVVPDESRAWVLDARGWVVAGTGPVAADPSRQLSWAERALYRVVAGGRTELRSERPERTLRLDEPLVAAALAGEAGQHWGQDPDNAAVRNTVAVPVILQGEPHGAVVLEASSDGLLLVTNRALGRLLISTLLVTVGLAAGLWWFASRLSRRVQRLSGAVSEAMDDTAHPRDLPLTADGDELGELARNNARLLRAVADYTGYLQKLASRLSHELKTPLAITRSSLDNLDTQSLDDEGRRFLARAREGLDRQTAIVRAMSEASRLEAAVRAADWEEADLSELLRHCVEAYRGVHPGREIELLLPESPVLWRCAPDLLVQALDKLVDNAIGLTGADDTVTVALEPAERGMVIAVRNTGSRLPDVLHEQLFDSLVSLRERGEAGRHLGLGLHIVRLVAEAHGGRAKARNLPDGAGVEFTIGLPAA